MSTIGSSKWLTKLKTSSKQGAWLPMWLPLNPFEISTLIFRIYDITLDVAQPVQDGEEVNAWGIEQCQCPPEYDGLSCQVDITPVINKRMIAY
jgi:hypothetical protein